MAANDPAQRIEIARAGRRGKDRVAAARAQRYTTLADYITAAVDQAPPLTEVQRARLAALLLGARRDGGAAA